MANRKPLPEQLIDEDGEVREITAEDVALFKPFTALPAAEQKVLLGLRKRGPQKAPKKVPVSIRLSPDVAEARRLVRLSQSCPSPPSPLPGERLRELADFLFAAPQWGRDRSSHSWSPRH